MYLIFTFREFKSIQKGKTAILHLCFCTEKNRRLGSKKARYIRAFRRRHLFLPPHYGRSVIIGFQKTQIYQWFAGSRQEVFILIHRQPRFDKCVRCKFAVEFYSGMGYTVSERS